MKDTGFRRWLHELWTLNCDERLEFKLPPYSQQEYFQRYKYWLKREYRHQTKTSIPDPRSKRG